MFDCVDALELEGSLHDDDNVYHYRPVRPQHSDDHDTVPKINHATAGGHHFDVDYPSQSDGEDSGGGGRAFVRRASLMLSLGVGAGVLLVVAILGAVCGVAVRNRRRRRRKSVDRVPPPPVVESYALVPLSSRRPDVDPLPDVGAASPVPRRSPASTATTPRSSRRTAVPSASVQQLEWQRMLRTAECDDDLEDEPGPPLPPPPAFLLRAGAGHRAPIVADEILDGYHSGDNVDDDIERIGYVPAHVHRR